MILRKSFLLIAVFAMLLGGCCGFGPHGGGHGKHDRGPGHSHHGPGGDRGHGR
ncbi:hypothetical protein SAMN05192560_2255 [Methylobacillus rhizosphaerae]|uniref:Lipoprotein n=1 Tax=Methylobacillus rhizosphaerae TaxID=551994 RepID=A0A239B2U7_9PROT|nr:hypothetical protein SAMN05192560_2255 [Methylobacillus rhizosphaerae]